MVKASSKSLLFQVTMVRTLHQFAAFKFLTTSFLHECCMKHLMNTAVGHIQKVVFIPEQVPGSGSEAVSPDNVPMPPPPHFDAPHFPDFASSVLEALNTNSVNITALKMEAIEFSALLPGPKEASDGHLQDDVLKKHDKGPAEPAKDNQQGCSVGHVVDSQSITALEAQLQEAASSEISMNCPPNLLTDSYVGSELPSEPRYVSISLLSLPKRDVQNYPIM